MERADGSIDRVCEKILLPGGCHGKVLCGDVIHAYLGIHRKGRSVKKCAKVIKCSICLANEDASSCQRTSSPLQFPDPGVCLTCRYSARSMSLGVKGIDTNLFQAPLTTYTSVSHFANSAWELS